MEFGKGEAPAGHRNPKQFLGKENLGADSCIQTTTRAEGTAGHSSFGEETPVWVLGNPTPRLPTTSRGFGAGFVVFPRNLQR